MSTATSTEPVAVEPLPDGRELHVRADGTILVVGAAERCEHPVEGVDWIRRTPPRPRARRVSRSVPRLPRTIRPDSTDAIAWRRAAAINRREAHARADALLRSLLDPRQFTEYTATGWFWVTVPQGRLRFGHLYSIRFEPADGSPMRSLCVVPVRHNELPLPDIWANLLLAVRDDPDHFFAVAIDRTRA